MALVVTGLLEERPAAGQRAVRVVRDTMMIICLLASVVPPGTPGAEPAEVLRVEM